jgi:hypothetical protein
MVFVERVLIDGLVLSAVFTVFVVGSLLWNYRLWIQDFPPDIRDMVPPKTAREKRLTAYLAAPMFLIVLGGPLVSLLLVESQLGGQLRFLTAWLHAYLVWQVVNVWDWLVIDWIGLSLIDPHKPPIPGTEGAAGYRNYRIHFIGFIKGSVVGIVIAAVPAGLVLLV